MPKKPPKLRLDVNEIAYRIAQAATGEGERPLPPSQRPEKNPDAVERGRQGGRKGGVTRMEALTPRKRKALAKKAANIRWHRGLNGE